VRDVLTLPQEVAAYFPAAELDRPLLSAREQGRMADLLRERHFAPWGRTRPAHARADAFWGLALLRQNRHYGENLRPLESGFRAQMEALAQPEGYPNTLRPAIATANTSLRVLPTERPGFLKPDKPGEGYPFDYWQNSGLLAGTPVLVTHLSSDGAWALVESRLAAGWVRVADIAYVDAAFMEQWQSLALAAITREGAPVAARLAEEGEAPAFLFTGRIGMLLPLAEADAGGLALLAPARDATGRAAVMAVRMAPGDAEPAPVPLTARNYARLADQLMGQPYGWGGFLNNRDCSALLLDLYAPFGIFLPRNSSQQARAGQFLPWKDLAPAEKEAMLLARGVPLLTLVHKPGHIMMYLGARGGRAIILHDLWGLRTRDAGGREGRFVVGRVAVTTLTPGAELPEVARGGLLLPTLDGMTLVAPGN
jgi:cell wall-associated NlpC family hydrolase